MKTPMDLATLQKEYDQMKAIAMESISNGIALEYRFERELTLLMRAVVAMGGKS
jgi:hypothetical protein